MFRKTNFSGVVLAVSLMLLFVFSGLAQGAQEITQAADSFLKSVPQNKLWLISVAELKALIEEKGDSLFILDVRPDFMYKNGHIPGSVNVPLPTLIDNLNQIPKDKTVAVVCSLDTNSAFAVSVLQMLGYEAWIVEGGVPGWVKTGSPLEK
ncbi:rhodanese-like domain-containing protein [Thermatribacter velox]|uniref:Rhodanese-like domain-containing protein n=1 Tax=Thermatribacter velox TaxID=3039681 RepID=A0ABZ2Y8R7_9BACT